MGRQSFTLSKKTEEMLTKIIEHDVSNVANKSEAVRNAVIIYKLLLDELDAGNQIGILDAEQKIKKILLLAI